MRMRLSALFSCCLLSCLLWFCPSPVAAATVTPDFVRIPALIDGQTYALEAAIYRPADNQVHPLAVINHGRSAKAAERKSLKLVTQYKAQAEALVQDGFIVVVPVRRGYGQSEGADAERSNSSTSYQAGLAGAKDVAQVVQYMQTQPSVDRSRTLLIGQSCGGLVSVAAATLPIPGLIGVVNFAGGLRTLAYKDAPTGSWNLQDEEQLAQTYFRYGQKTRVPMLWIYTENDSYFPPSLSPKLHASFVAGGGNAEFHLLPPYGKDGHRFFAAPANIPTWLPLLKQFLQHSIQTAT